MESNVQQSETCAICLDRLKYPHGKPNTCEHQFCFKCIDGWMKQRSNCPLCNQTPKYLIRIEETGQETRHAVRKRTARQFENQLLRDQQLDEENSEDSNDITIAHACCRVCQRSDNDHLLMLCDGIVGHNVDGSEIRCNVAYHCYCLPEKLDRLPDGDWFCPFCAVKPENVQGSSVEQLNLNVLSVEASVSGTQQTGNISLSSQNPKSLQEEQNSDDVEEDERMETIEGSSIASSNSTAIDDNENDDNDNNDYDDNGGDDNNGDDDGGGGGGGGGSDAESKTPKSEISHAGSDTYSEDTDSSGDVDDDDHGKRNVHESSTESSNGRSHEDSESGSTEGTDSEDDDDGSDGDDESDMSDSEFFVIQPMFSDRYGRGRSKPHSGSGRVTRQVARFRARSSSKIGSNRCDAVVMREEYFLTHRRRHHST